MARGKVKVRLKMIRVGGEKLLLVRIVAFNDRGHKALADSLLADVTADRLQSDGEVFRVRGPALEAVAQRIIRTCTASYDPNLEHTLPAAPNPWQIPEEPPRDRSKRERVYMARVWHPELEAALAFQTRKFDDDFLIDFRRTTAHARNWRRFRDDLGKVWVIAEHYEGIAHEVLDRHYTCYWDEFMAGEEWDILDPPRDTRYPIRTLSDAEFAVLGVEPGCSIPDLNDAYRSRKEDYKDGRIPVEEWMDVDEAYQRIRRHHFPKEPDELPAPVAPQEILLLLRERFPDVADQSRWFHRFNHSLDATPEDLARSSEGARQVASYLRVMLALVPPASSPVTDA